VTTLLLLGALLLALTPVIWAIRRSTELFVIKVRDGEAHFFRGSIPQGLLDELADVVHAPRVEHVDLVVVRRDGRPELSVRGQLHPDQVQRLRNVLGQYSVQRISAGGRRRSRGAFGKAR
jgi:hypothetical protein